MNQKQRNSLNALIRKLEWSLAFKEAHRLAREDRQFDSSKSYAYYFRLHLLSFQDEARIKRTGLARGFVVHGRDKWA